jgi:hypothetical protein
MPSFEETSFAKKRKTQDVQVIKRKPSARPGSKIFSPFRVRIDIASQFCSKLTGSRP